MSNETYQDLVGRFNQILNGDIARSLDNDAKTNSGNYNTGYSNTCSYNTGFDRHTENESKGEKNE